MTIDRGGKAKFDSRCPSCKQQIRKGDNIRWEPGTKAVHQACVDSPQCRDCGRSISLEYQSLNRWNRFANRLCDACVEDWDAGAALWEEGRSD